MMKARGEVQVTCPPIGVLRSKPCASNSTSSSGCGSKTSILVAACGGVVLALRPGASEVEFDLLLAGAVGGHQVERETAIAHGP